MTANVQTLMRYTDPSGVSGTGPIGTVVEFESGLVAFHWDTDTPSVTVYTDIRHVLKLHGHAGASRLVPAASSRLEGAYQKVMRYLLNEYTRPVTVGPHPDHMDRLRLTFQDEPDWRMYVALMDGSTYSATHTEVNSEVCHRWISPDGDLWLEYFTPLADDNDPLAVFDREDR